MHAMYRLLVQIMEENGHLPIKLLSFSCIKKIRKRTTTNNGDIEYKSEIMKGRKMRKPSTKTWHDIWVKILAFDFCIVGW